MEELEASRDAKDILADAEDKHNTLLKQREEFMKEQKIAREKLVAEELKVVSDFRMKADMAMEKERHGHKEELEAAFALLQDSQGKLMKVKAEHEELKDVHETVVSENVSLNSLVEDCKRRLDEQIALNTTQADAHKRVVQTLRRGGQALYRGPGGCRGPRRWC